MTFDYETNIHYIDDIVMQLISLDQNTKELVLNITFFGIFKVFVMKNALRLHEAMTY